MSKDCGNHGYSKCKRHKLYRRLAAWALVIILLVLLAVLIVWLVLRPTKPRFFLTDATMLQLNLTAPTLLTATIQPTISTRNPNDRIGIYYDRLDAYAQYKDQRITLPASIPPTYQGHGDVDLWSPYLCGFSVPVAPYVAAALAQDEGTGIIFLRVKLDGRIRWKVGTWISDHYHIYVDCPAILAFGDGRGGSAAADYDAAASAVLRFQQISSCSVEV